MNAILLADDHPAILRWLGTTLRAGGKTVVTAQNGQEALDQARAVHPDAAILDVSMPVMDGIEAAQKLHKMMPHLPIILFSAHADLLRERLSLEDTGIVAIFDKSKGIADLLRTIEKLSGLLN